MRSQSTINPACTHCGRTGYGQGEWVADRYCCSHSIHPEGNHRYGPAARVVNGAQAQQD
jgi:hypothetical protein